MKVFYGFLVVLLACGQDSILDRADELKLQKDGSKSSFQEKNQSQRGSGASPPQPQSQPPPQPNSGQVGKPVEPQAGIPDEPTAGGGVVIDGPAVSLSGVIEVSDWGGGPIRLDVFDGDQQDITGPRPSVVAVGEVKRPGPFVIEVPVSAKNVWLGGFSDDDQPFDL